MQKKLDAWTECGFITAEQAGNILQFEGTDRVGSAWKILFTIAGLMIGLGFMLLIGANWDAMPPKVKLVCDFALFGAIIYGAYWSITNKRTHLTEMFLVMSFLMVGATIGLIAQIFHLSGGWRSFTASWALLSLPFPLFSRSRLFNAVWIIMLFGAVDWETVFKFFKLFEDFPVIKLALTTGLLGMLCYAGQQIYKNISDCIIMPLAFADLARVVMYAFAIIGGAVLSYEYFTAHVFVAAFLFIRMAITFIEKNMRQFRNDALLTELYIVYFFISLFKDLFSSGIGLIIGGILLIVMLYVLKKTAGFIKGMEVFKNECNTKETAVGSSGCSAGMSGSVAGDTVNTAGHRARGNGSNTGL